MVDAFRESPTHVQFVVVAVDVLVVVVVVVAPRVYPRFNADEPMVMDAIALLRASPVTALAATEREGDADSAYSVKV